MRILIGGFLGLFLAVELSADDRRSVTTMSSLSERLDCDQTNVETEIRRLSDGKQVRIADFRCYELEKSGCALSVRYLTDTDLFGKEQLAEVEEIWKDLQKEADAEQVRRVIVWADNDRLGDGASFDLERGSDGRWRKGSGFPPERSSCGTLEPSSLADAALWGDTERLRELIETGEDFDRKDNFGATPLFYALYRGKSEAARLLIEAGADPNATVKPSDPFSGWTELGVAARQGDLEMVNRLLEAGADVNGTTLEGYTALGAAAMRGRSKVVHRLLSRGARVDAASEAGATALMIATREGRGTVVAELLAAGSDPNLADKEGKTALHYGIEGRESWREAGARGRDCRLAIIWALLEAGVSPDLLDGSGRSAFAFATQAQDSELTDLLSAFRKERGAQ